MQNVTKNILGQYGAFMGTVSPLADGTFTANVLRNCARTMTQSLQQVAICDSAETAEMVVRGELQPAAFGVTAQPVAVVEPAPVAQPEAPTQTVAADVTVETVQGVTIVARKGYTLTQPAESKFFKLTANDGAMLSECEGEQYDYCWLTDHQAAPIVAQPADAATDTIREALADACADAELTEEQTAEAEQSFYAPQLADEVRTEAETAALYDAAYVAAVEHIDWLQSQSESPADYALPYQ